ncbi:MAG: hypothetical protein KDD52_03310 [Bdellovibrionales bacterium]|nr:hypothetical protein [Bdellovibrionales bacterium]
MDEFDQRGAFESYIGHADIIFGVEGITSAKETPVNFDFTYDPDDGGFVLSGLPKAPDMSLYDFFPEKGAMGYDYKNLVMEGLIEGDYIDSDFDKMDFSGIAGEVLKKNHVRFTGFAKASDGFKKLGFKVRGESRKSGITIYGSLYIYISLYDFFAFLEEASGMKERLEQTLSLDGGKTSLAESGYEGNEEIDILTIHFVGQGVTGFF